MNISNWKRLQKRFITNTFLYRCSHHVLNGGSAEVIQADVSKEEDIHRMMKELPGFDILIHNAVYAKSNKPKTISIEQWEKKPTS
ncbi:hypothetical protein [Alteribacillus bidgolensis]|uniref:hypothetical protein n=1 Tax=Alteribacillus bidgolensis TaxID=930129 RepID=UPI001472754C|nr:hypothetical protein [Alteribacillus bidgolensis]